MSHCDASSLAVLIGTSRHARLLGGFLRLAAVSPQARAVFGLPLRVGTVRLGALNLYRDRSGPLSGDQHADALVIADVAARWVLEAQAGAPLDAVAEELETGADFHSRCTTRQAWSRSRRGSASPRR